MKYIWGASWEYLLFAYVKNKDADQLKYNLGIYYSCRTQFYQGASHISAISTVYLAWWMGDVSHLEARQLESK